MTSTHRNNPQHTRHLGFTLIEVVVTLVIISVILASAVLFLSQNNNRKVAEITQKTQILAKETLRESKFSNRAQSIFITSSEIWSAPESSIQNDPTETDSSIQRIEIPEGVTVSCRDSSNANWVTLAKNDPPFVWPFTRNGLCGAVSIRFESDEAVQQMTFHPLTAGELTDAQ